MATVHSSTSASDSDATPSRSRIADAILVVGFVGLLFVPVLAQPRILRDSLFATRQSGLRLRAYTDIATKVESWLPPGRNELIKAYNGARWNIFGLLPSTVVAGADGWLFYDSDPANDGHGFADFRGGAQPDRSVLAAWRQEAVLRQQFMSELGIDYQLVIVPDKQTVYGEVLPPSIARTRAPTVRMDAALTAIDGALKRPVIDLRGVLAKRKALNPDPLYFRSDTHWNCQGAWFAYQAIRASWPKFTDANVVDIAHWTGDDHDFRGDLAMTTRTPERYQEKTRWLVPDRDHPAIISGTGERLIAARKPLGGGCPSAFSDQITVSAICATTTRNQALPSAVIFMDSFGMAIAPYLAQDFSQAIFVMAPLNVELIRKARPNIVLQITVQRYLDKALQ